MLLFSPPKFAGPRKALPTPSPGASPSLSSTTATAEPVAYRANPFFLAPSTSSSRLKRQFSASMAMQQNQQHPQQQKAISDSAKRRAQLHKRSRSFSTLFHGTKPANTRDQLFRSPTKPSRTGEKPSLASGRAYDRLSMVLDSESDRKALDAMLSESTTVVPPSLSPPSEFEDLYDCAADVGDGYARLSMRGMALHDIGANDGVGGSVSSGAGTGGSRSSRRRSLRHEDDVIDNPMAIVRKNEEMLPARAVATVAQPVETAKQEHDGSGVEGKRTGNNNNNNDDRKKDEKNSTSKTKNVKLALDFNKMDDDRLLKENDEPKISRLTAAIRPEKARSGSGINPGGGYMGNRKMRGLNTVNFPVFVPHLGGGVHLVNVTVAQNSLRTLTGRDLVSMALGEYRKQTGQTPMRDNSDAFLIYVAEDDGSIDTDWPKLDRRRTLADIGINQQIVMVLDPSYHISGNTASTSSVSESDVDFRLFVLNATLTDVLVEVYLPTSTLPKYVPLPPDLLVRDILKVLCTQFNLELDKHALQLISHDGRTRAIPKQWRDKTLHSIKIIERLGIVRMMPLEDIRTSARLIKPSSMDSMTSSSVSSAHQESEVNLEAMSQSLDPVSYFEFSVIKTNKFGVRQERLLGMDRDKIYNAMPKSGSGFFGITIGSSKTKKPERPIDTLKSIVYNPKGNQRQFQLEFDDGETLFYETRTVVETQEIVKRLKRLQQVKRHQSRNNMKPIIV